MFSVQLQLQKYFSISVYHNISGTTVCGHDYVKINVVLVDL